MDSDLAALRARLDRLERQNRRMGWVGAVGAVCGAAGMALAAASFAAAGRSVEAQTQVPREIAAEAFVVKDRYGVTRATLSTAVSSDGRVGSSLSLNGPNANSVGVFIIATGDISAVNVDAPGSSKANAGMGARLDGSSFVVTRDAIGRTAWQAEG